MKRLIKEMLAAAMLFSLAGCTPKEPSVSAPLSSVTEEPDMPADSVQEEQPEVQEETADGKEPQSLMDLPGGEELAGMYRAARYGQFMSFGPDYDVTEVMGESVPVPEELQKKGFGDPYAPRMIEVKSCHSVEALKESMGEYLTDAFMERIWKDYDGYYADYDGKLYVVDYVFNLGYGGMVALPETFAKQGDTYVVQCAVIRPDYGTYDPKDPDCIAEKGWMVYKQTEKGWRLDSVSREIGKPDCNAYVKVNKLNVRNQPSTSGKKVEQVNADHVFEVYEQTKAEGYTWYRIGENRWIADQDGAWVELREVLF